MTALAALLLLASPASAQNASAVVDRTMRKVDILLASESGKDAREAADTDKAAERLFAEIKPLGWRAAAPLGAAAREAARPPKSRLIAVSFLGLLADPAAFRPLEAVLRDEAQEPYVRAAAAQSLPGQGLDAKTTSKALCSALVPMPPREVEDAVLVAVAPFGCAEADGLAAAARAFGPRPAGRDLGTARKALEALGRSRGGSTARALLDLVVYFPAGGDARAAAILALDARRAELAAWREADAAPVVEDALRTETSRPDVMVPLVRLAAAMGPRLAPSLERLSRHADAEVLVEAAEALAAQGRVKALPALKDAVAGAMTDPRFSPKEGRPDPAVLLSRLDKAVAALEKTKGATAP